MQFVSLLLLAGSSLGAPHMERELGQLTNPELSKRIDPAAHRDFDLEAIRPIKQVQLGPRPFYLVDDLEPSALKDKLQKCTERKSKASSWSIGHRGGGTLQFPEHTVQSNLAGARMGAGVLECDVAFTSDLELVCRHSQCDLHTTTNVVATELGKKCTTPFQPATANSTAKAKCCTSDFTLEEILSLCGKMDSFNSTATTPEDYLGNVATWRTTLYNQCGTLLSLKEHIAMVEKLGLEHTPELKLPEVPMPFKNDYTQEKYAQQLIDTYRDCGVDPKKFWPQSFHYPDILYWIKNAGKYGSQAVLLDETLPIEDATANLTQYKQDGVKVIAPPTPYLLTAENGTLVPSEYGKKAKELGFDIITWSLERSPPVKEAKEKKDYYYETFLGGLHRDGDLLTAIDVMAQQVGVKKMFADWSGTVTFYANCFGLK